MYCGCPGIHAQLVEDRSKMGMHGTFTQHQPVGNLGVAQPIGHQIQDVDLPGSQAQGPALKLFFQSRYSLLCKTHGAFGVQLPACLVRLEPGSLTEAAADAGGLFLEVVGHREPRFLLIGLLPPGRRPEQLRGQIEVP